jgi:hypothetical protein
MANSLMDLFSGSQQQPQDNLQQGGGISGMSNSLVGLGMGLLQPYNPWAGTNAWSNALQGYQTGAALDQRTKQQQQQMAHQLRQEAFQRSQAAQAQSNWEKSYARGDMTEDIKEFNFAKKEDPSLTFMDWMKRKAQFQNKSALNPTYYYDADGKLRIGQLGTGGGMAPVDLPPGATLADPQQYLNTGTGFVGVPKRAPAGGGAVIPGAGTGDLTSPVPISGAPATSGNFIPIDKRTPARETELGKGEAKAITQLPAIEANTSRTLARLEELEKHPGLDAATGFIMGKVPFAVTPAARDATARMQEIQSEAWTQAVQDLRGMGALSNAEGSRIENARSRLAARDVSTGDYRKAIADLKEVLRSGLNNARMIASGKMQPYTDQGGAASPAPQGAVKTQNWTRDADGNLVRQ